MKTIIAIVVVGAVAVTAIGLGAQPEATARIAEKIEADASANPPRVDACLELAAMAHSAADAVKRGVRETDIIQAAKDNGNPTVLRVTRYTLTVGAPPDVARSMAYAKCVSGDFGVLA